MYEQVALITYKFNLTGEYIEALSRPDRLQLVELASAVIKAENPDPNQKDKFEFRK